jgi:hypothetical protein
MVAAHEASPLWIHPLLTCRQSGPESGRYALLQRLFTPSPNADQEEAEIETALEMFIGPDGSALWRRIVVRSGPTCPKQVTHASFMLPDDSAPVVSDSILCWAAFPERPDHKLLCVLAKPTLLCIWDVYPKGEQSDLGGEGHSIPLPFEACGIHAIAGNHGLLLQRAETMEDRLVSDAAAQNSKSWASLYHHQGDDDDDGFVLKAPPRPVRLRESTGTSLSGLNVSTTVASNNSVPSLFSLSHPLDDVLPMANISPDTGGSFQPAIGGGGGGGGVVTDVFEKVLFVGVLRWTDPNEAVIDRKEYTQPICVTYHTHKRRYGIWRISCCLIF